MILKSDEEIIRLHDTSCRVRAKIELEVCHSLIKELRQLGYLELHDGETSLRVDDEQQMITELFGLDEAYIQVREDGGKAVGWVYLVFGNDGYDVINDYTTSLEGKFPETEKLINLYTE